MVSQVVLEGRLDLAAARSCPSRRTLAVLVEHPHPGLSNAGHPVEQRDPAGQPGLRSTSCTGPSVLSRRSAKSSSSSCLGVVGDLGEVARGGTSADQRRTVLLGQRLLPAQQRQARREPLQVPGEVPDVGLVEVVDVEDQPAVGVHVGAEVLGVQVTVDPDAAGALVDPRVARRSVTSA